MKIKLKILLLAFVMITFLVSNIYAVDMFLTSTNNGTEGTVVTSPSPSPEDENYDNDVLLSEDGTTTQNISKEVEQNLDDETLLSDFDNENENYEDLSTMQSTVVTSSATSSADTLSTSDIINIILIAVCIVLIFLAVAILMRLK